MESNTHSKVTGSNDQQQQQQPVIMNYNFNQQFISYWAAEGKNYMSDFERLWTPNHKAKLSETLNLTSY